MRTIAFITGQTDIWQILDDIGVDSELPHISQALGPALQDRLRARQTETDVRQRAHHSAAATAQTAGVKGVGMPHTCAILDLMRLTFLLVLGQVLEAALRPRFTPISY